MNRNRKYRAMSAVLTVILAIASAASAEWKEKVLYSFQGVPDGAVPAGGVVFDKAGNLYGATTDGGSSSCDGPGQCGTVYELSAPAKQGDPWTGTVLYVFKGHAYNDGATPGGGVIMDEAGNLYGAAAYGGSGPCTLAGGSVGCGAVYELSPPARQGDPWTEKVLYSFQGGKDGYVAVGDLVFDKARNLYGATWFGGGKGTTCDSAYGGQCGTVFELSPPKTKGGKWTEKVLHAFAGGTDGASPNGGLVLDSNGAIYGTTPIGGFDCPHHSGQGCGTVFELKPPTSKNGAWTEKQVHIFKNGTDGTQPTAGVILDDAGALYGGAEGGSNGCGVVFRLAQSGDGLWKETILYSFGGNSYYYGPAVARFDSSGNIYGTTYVGPGSLAGSVFRLKPPARKGEFWTARVLYGFTGGLDGLFPAATLTLDEAGNLYGATQEGGGKGTCQGYCGTVFEVSP